MIKTTCLLAGLGLLVFAWAGPLPEKASGSFAAHMSLHMLVVALAAPLLAVGIAGGAWDPVVHQPGLFPPIVASVVEMIAVWAWHAPALHHFARDSSAGFVIEQGCFLLSGFWLWLSAVGGRGVMQDNVATVADGQSLERSALERSALERSVGSHAQQRRAAGVLALLLTSMHMTLLGALLAFAPRLLFAHDSHSHDMPSNVTAQVIHAERLFQQQLGGAIMLVIGGAAYLVGGLALTRQMLPIDHSHMLEADSA